MSWPLRGQLWARRLLAMLMCMALPHGSLAVPESKENCSISDLPKFEYSELEPKYTSLVDSVPSLSHVVYQCKENFTRNPNAHGTIFCMNGSWIYTNDSCGPVPESKENCSISDLPKFEYSELEPKYTSLLDSVPSLSHVVYQCKENFTRNPNAHGTIFCMNGSWIFTNDSCGPVPESKENCSISDLPKFEYSELEPKYTSLLDSVPSLSHVVYQCKENFTRNPNAHGTIFCMNGSWIFTNDSCGPVPESKENCSISDLPKFEYSELEPKYTSLLDSVPSLSHVVYQCKENFTRNPNAHGTIFCMNGSWIYTNDSCGPVPESKENCSISDLPKFEYSELEPKYTSLLDSVPSLSHVVYQCKENFTRNPNAHGTIFCMNGSWIFTNDSCGPVPESKGKCLISDLPTFEYSELEPNYTSLPDSVPSLSRVVYKCKENFHRKPCEDGTIFCVNDSWVYTKDSCGPGCGRPENLKYARLPDHEIGNSSSFPVGTIIGYECNPGYQIIPGVDPVYAVCGNNFTWLEVTEFCEAIPESKGSCYTSKLPKFEYSELEPEYISLSDVPSFSHVVYQCKENFHRNPDGNGTVFCANGSWIYTNDSCGPGCKRPEHLKYARVPDHAVRNKNSFPVGTVLTYECNPGYQIIPGMDPASAVCGRNYTWLEMKEFCEEIKLNCSTANLPEFDYSELAPEYVDLPDAVTTATIVTYRCKEGFLPILGGNDTVICVNGSWKYSKDSCGPGCRRPRNLIYARLPEHVVGNSSSFAIGTVLTYECNPGYKVIYGQDPAHVTCEESLQWSEATEFCEEIKENCSTEELPKFQYSEPTREYHNLSTIVRNGTHVVYECKEDSHPNPDGNTIIVCETGSWIPKEDPCGPGCQRPKNLIYATIPGDSFGNASSFPIGTIFQFYCNPGYKIIAGVNVTNVTCKKDYSWSEITEFCEGDCATSKLPTFNYSKLQREYEYLPVAVPPFTQVVYQCKEGFYKKPGQNGSIVCIETSWIYSGDHCGPGCPKPKPIKYAAVPEDRLKINYFPTGTVVRYRCNRGYKIIPQMKPTEVTCRKNLTWTEATEFCEGDCATSNLPKMKYAKLAPIHENIPDVVPPFTEFTYICKEGFNRNPYENDTVTCMETSWIYNAEPCGPSCQKPSPLEYAQVPDEVVEINYFPEGTILTYSCNEGYINLTEPAQVTCGKNLMWSKPTVPDFCEGNCSTESMPILNYSQPGYINYSDIVPPFTLLFYECKEGFYRDPDADDHLMCFEMTWIYDKDPCGPSCQEPPQLKYGVLQQQDTTYDHYFPPGRTLSYECREGYVLMDEMEPASVTCGNNLKWSEPKEFCEAIILPETTELSIRNAKIVRGEKPEYSLGDKITVKCRPGFTLNGDPVIEYVGGNEWSPKIPSCSLNVFVSTLIAGAMGFVALLGFATYKMYSSRRSSYQPGSSTASRSSVRVHSATSNETRKRGSFQV